MSSKSFNLILNNRISSFKKSIEVDSDKSISIRSFLIGAISHNISTAKNVLESEDVLSTIKCLKKLGVKIKKKKTWKLSYIRKRTRIFNSKKKYCAKFWKFRHSC